MRAMTIADLLVGFYRVWHGRFGFRGAGALLRAVAGRHKALQRYPFEVAGVGTIGLDFRDIAAFMWLNEVVDGHHQEEALISAIGALAKPGWVLWDIGANMGVVSALCARKGFGFARIEAVEPNPALSAALRGLFKDSPVVRVHGVALGEREGDALLV